MKRNKIIMMVLCALLCTQYFLLTSCNKNPKGSFIIKGRMMDSCGGNPMSNINLVVDHFKGGASFNIRYTDSIGVGRTDANGNFAIVCQNWKEGEIRLSSNDINMGSYKVKGLYVGDDIQNKVVEYGNIYAYVEFYGCANITVKGSVTAADTLYIAGKPYYPISVSTFKVCLKHHPGYIGYDVKWGESNPYDYYWGFGKAAYDSAVAYKLASRKFTVIESLCRDGKVVDVTMEK